MPLGGASRQSRVAARAGRTGTGGPEKRTAALRIETVREGMDWPAPRFLPTVRGESRSCAWNPVTIRALAPTGNRINFPKKQLVGFDLRGGLPEGRTTISSNFPGNIW